MKFFKKFFSFLEDEEDDYDDGDSVIDNFADEYIMPHIYGAIEDIITNIIDGIGDVILSVVHATLFKGESYDRRGRSHRHGYSRTSVSRGKEREKQSWRKKKRPDPIEVTFETQRDAVDVKDRLCDVYEDEDEVTVAEFYDAVNDICEEEYRTDSADEDYGWDSNPKNWVIKRKNGYYIISTPKVRRLE